VTALRHIDHGVTCDGLTHGTGQPLPCSATVWQSEVQDHLKTHAIGGFRRWLRKQGWQLGAVLPDDPKADPLDFCPQHRKDPK
jgi:hypothetical protein